MAQQQMVSRRASIGTALRSVATRRVGTVGTVVLAAAAFALVGELGAVLALIQTGGIDAARASINEALGITVGTALLGGGLVMRAYEDEINGRRRVSAVEAEGNAL